ncbi:MAG: hypothetical protein NTX79_06510 [Candidatus Micrarchaeota archaeon]|nr:hypothetical protein [Candidatus Micrarchaeota archaeon]
MAFDFVSLANSLKTIAVFLATITIAYAGFSLVTNRSPEQRNEWKEIIAGVFIGIVLLYLVPLIAAQLGGGSYCG